MTTPSQASQVSMAFFTRDPVEPAPFLELLSRLVELPVAEYATVWADAFEFSTGYPMPLERREFLKRTASENKAMLSTMYALIRRLPGTLQKAMIAKIRSDICSAIGPLPQS